MAINLLTLQPNVVSRDLSGYITLMFGPAKIGKTTFGSKMPKPLLLAAEKGYSTIPGIIAQDITSWGEFKQVVRELKKPEVKELYKSLIIDTVDIFADLCQKYICQQLGIESIGDGGWSTNGWSKYKKEFEETFRTLAQLGYAIVFLSHDKEKTIKPQNGSEYQQIGSSMQTSALSIVENMSDIICYAHMKTNIDGTYERVLTLRSLDNSVRCGCRFSQMPAEISFSYEALTQALNEAIDKEAQMTNNKFVTDAPMASVEVVSYDFDVERNEFQTLVSKIMENNQSDAIKITSVVNRFLGKNKKVSDATPEQAELIYLINDELKHQFNFMGENK